MSVQFFTRSAQTAPSAAPKVPAQRCAHCRRELPSGEGHAAPFIGIVGPECVKKYAPLVLALSRVNGLEALEWDEGTVRLAHHVLWRLRGIGVAVAVVDLRPGVKALEIKGLSRRADAVVKSWAQVRSEFEQTLRRAEAERGEMIAPTAGPLCACTDGWRNPPLQGCPHCRGTGRVVA